MLSKTERLMNVRSEIYTINLQRIFDSVGNPTVETTLNYNFTASCPSGISESSYAADSIDVEKSIDNFYKIRRKFIGKFNQKSFDALLNEHVDKLGSTLTTSLSLAFFATIFNTRYTEQLFPRLAGKVIGGGLHSLSKGPLMQEFLVIPTEAPTIRQSIETNFKIWRDVGKELAKRGSVGLDYESGWTAEITDEEALQLITDVIEKKKYEAVIGIDAAASSWYDKKKRRYVYNGENYSKDQLVKFWSKLIKDYNIKYLEDPFHENHFDAFKKLNKKTKDCLIVGDDLIATNPLRMDEAIKNKSISGVIIKPNQIGTVSEAFEVIKKAYDKDIMPIASHRSGETCCPLVAKMAMFTPIAKFGIAGLRTCKLNELIHLWNLAESPKMRKFP